METVARGLRKVASGRKIEAVATSGVPSNRLPLDPALAGTMVGRRIGAVARRGKYIVVGLSGKGTGRRGDPRPEPDAALGGLLEELRADAAEEALVLHLGMSGQLRWVAPGGEAPISHAHLRVFCSGGWELRMVDPRRFGFAAVARLGELGAKVPALAALGPDPLGEAWGAEALAVALAGRRARLKSLLLDQEVIAGLGNIYTDEILFRAKLAWDRPGGSLSPAELEALASAMGEVLGAAVEAGGSTLADAQYCDVFGAPGSYQRHHLVYGRAGLPCGRCGETLQKQRFAGRFTTFCPACQR